MYKNKIAMQLQYVTYIKYYEIKINFLGNIQFIQLSVLNDYINTLKNKYVNFLQYANKILLQNQIL